MEQKSIKDCTTQELKAYAYDRVVLIEKNQRELNLINQELARREGGSDKATANATDHQPV